MEFCITNVSCREIRLWAESGSRRENYFISLIIIVSYCVIATFYSLLLKELPKHTDMDTGANFCFNSCHFVIDQETSLHRCGDVLPSCHGYQMILYILAYRSLDRPKTGDRFNNSLAVGFVLRSLITIGCGLVCFAFMQQPNHSGA